jgi:hypothetical protein
MVMHSVMPCCLEQYANGPVLRSEVTILLHQRLLYLRSGLDYSRATIGRMSAVLGRLPCGPR